MTMNKLNFVRDGESKLPPGFRFQPTDEEIVFQYLSRKTFSHPLPAKIIPEIDVFNYDPWQLPADSDQEKYFFSNKLGGNNPTTCSGNFWKATGFAKRIICSKRMPIVGIRRCLVFYKCGKNGGAVRTDWIMHEYCIALSQNADAQKTKNSKGSLIRIGDWVLCRILNKRNATKADDDDEDDDDDTRWTYDFPTAEMSYTDSSSASSSSPHSDSSIFNEVSSRYNV